MRPIIIWITLQQLQIWWDCRWFKYLLYILLLCYMVIRFWKIGKLIWFLILNPIPPFVFLYWISRCLWFLVWLMALAHKLCRGGRYMLALCQSWGCSWSVVWLSQKRFSLLKMRMGTSFVRPWRTMMFLFNIRWSFFICADMIILGPLSDCALLVRWEYGPTFYSLVVVVMRRWFAAFFTSNFSRGRYNRISFDKVEQVAYLWERIRYFPSQ